MKSAIDPEAVVELRTLYRKLPGLTFEAAIALRAEDGKPLEGVFLERYRAAAAKVATVMNRIAELTVS